jgi:peptidoglycan hydrolase-like protein with peptidoglycan-binding domain
MKCSATKRRLNDSTDAVLKVLVENSEDDALLPLAETPVPAPTIRGPMFERAPGTPDVSADGENHAPDVEALQAFLVANGYKLTGVVDGQVGGVTVSAIKAFQRATGLLEDGIAGPITKRQVTAPTFDRRPHAGHGPAAAGGPFARGDTVRWGIGDAPGYMASAPVRGPGLALRQYSSEGRGSETHRGRSC